MAISANDISAVLSGGTENQNPDASLGGLPSNFPVLIAANNLFDKIRRDEEGVTEYRCVYYFNDSTTDTLYDPKIFLQTDIVHGEVQSITIVGAATGGQFTVKYTGATQDYNIVSSYNSDVGAWAQSFRDALRTVGELGGINVAGAKVGNTRTFTITFNGNACKDRFHDLLSIVSNNITGTAGSPLNAVAELVDNEITPPTGVTFQDAYTETPIAIEDLRPGDGLPVWLRRTVVEDMVPVADSFVLRIAGNTSA